MKTYILGYDQNENLTQYKSIANADWNAEEWVSIQAESLETAKAMYEEKFTEWQRSNEL